MKGKRTRPESVDDYVASFPPQTRKALTRVRGTIKQALPDAEEVVSYGIGAFKLHGRVVIYFAGFKEHYSIYPSTRRLEAAFARELKKYELSGRGTIRFPIADPVPSALIARLAKFRAREVMEKAKTKAAAKTAGPKKKTTKK